ncbi:MAG: hypothetical protein KBT03_04170 [Bacteroidales bacterium]|nr:hypothetical protein [Candidatus Scybalousia scybalohippi]
MKQTFRTFVELEKGISRILKQAEEETLKEMLDKLLDIIEENVYSVPATGSDYIRTRQLVARQYGGDDSYFWDITDVKVNRKGMITGGIEPSGNMLIRVPWTHTSLVNDDLTVDGYLDIIENGLSAENSIFGQIYGRPFWEEFQKWCKRNYTKIFKKHCRKLGLNLGSGFRSSYLPSSGINVERK